jgi:hypothetical protein
MGTVTNMLVPVSAIRNLPASAPRDGTNTVDARPLASVSSPRLIRVPFCVALQWYVWACPVSLVNWTGTGSPDKKPVVARDGPIKASELYRFGEKLPSTDRNRALEIGVNPNKRITARTTKMGPLELRATVLGIISD